MILDGKLLKRDMDMMMINAVFDDIDHDGVGGISFYSFWMWFSRELESYNERNPKDLWLLQPKNTPFNMYTLVSIRERALLRFSSKYSREKSH
jgi:hypothetical protein